MTNPTNAEEFRNLAEGADEIYEDGTQEFSVSEDDGSFFISQFGLRACFGGSRGQETPRRQFNREVNATLRSMGYEGNYNETGLV